MQSNSKNDKNGKKATGDNVHIMGDKQNMEEIYQKYARMVYKYLLSLTHDEGAAEELTQETFYQAIKSIERYDGSCTVSTWLCAIAKHQLSAWRRKNPEMESLDYCESESAAGKQENQTATERSGEEILLRNEARVDLMKRLHSCPEPAREVLYLRIFGNLSFREIGEIMGRTENWARVAFYRGKEKLRKEMLDDE